MNYLSYKNKELVFDLITMMSEITLATDPLTVLHPYAVADLSKKIAISLQLDEFTTKRIYYAGLLHDIGKMYIDANILTKQTSLTHDEYANLKKHSIYGANIIKSMLNLDDISLFVKHHHEWYDGKGYPSGLCGHEIPLESRIIGIADAFDAMLSPRSYKSARDINFIINELLKNSDTQFDSNLVNITIEILSTASEEIQSLCTDYILWSTLIITTRFRTHSVQGSLIKYSSRHFFKSNKFNFLSDLDKEEILDVQIHIHNNNQFFKLKVGLDAYEENQVYISGLNDLTLPHFYDF